MSRRGWQLAIGVIVAAGTGGLCSVAALPGPAVVTATVTALCAAWWVLEPIPIPATSLIPFAVFPLTGVLSSKAVAAAYGHHLILLLMGGFMLSKAIERSGAHRRMALGMVRVTGRSTKRMVFGFMLASAVCSMWISNTATTLMLLPVAIAVLGDKPPLRLQTALLLAIAYGASIGGVATPVGTPPNVIFMGIYESTTGTSVSFLEWMTIGVPVAAVFLPLAWLYLVRGLPDSRPAEIPALGAWRSPERRVLIVFAITALAWVFRSAPGGGWSLALGQLADNPAEFAANISDSTIALLAVSSMFLIPNGEGEPLLDWPTAATIPWGLLLLFGGGIAIASAFESSGLSTALGGTLASMLELPVVITVLIIALSVTFLTEVTSNTATTNLLMPVLAAAAVTADIDPRILMIPAALSASCAFMLPVATAPNAIMFGTGKVSTRAMAQTGFALNLIGAAIITAICATLL